jgi:hypothetical protein
VGLGDERGGALDGGIVAARPEEPLWGKIAQIDGRGVQTAAFEQIAGRGERRGTAGRRGRAAGDGHDIEHNASWDAGSALRLPIPIMSTYIVDKMDISIRRRGRQVPPRLSAIGYRLLLVIRDRRSG